MSTINTSEIINLYQSGFSSLQIASRLKTTKRLVLYRLSKAGIKRRELAEALRKFDINAGFFKHIDSEVKAYWLGFLLADGNITYCGRYNKSGVLRCTLQRRDNNHLQKFMTAINTNKTVKDTIATNRRTGKTYPASFVRITCTELCHDLDILGWQQFKRNGITTILDNIPDDLKRHTIRGLVDGDGWICWTNNRWNIGYCDLYITIVQWVKNWLSTGGSKIYRNNNRSFRFHCTGANQVRHIVQLLYNNCTISLDRKTILANTILQSQDRQA